MVGQEKVASQHFSVFANREKRKYYLPSKEMVCTCLNFTVCYFVSKMHNCNKGNFKRLPLLLLLLLFFDYP